MRHLPWNVSERGDGYTTDNGAPRLYSLVYVGDARTWTTQGESHVWDLESSYEDPEDLEGEGP